MPTEAPHDAALPTTDPSSPPSTASAPDDNREPTLSETVIQECIDAHNRAHKETFARTRSDYQAEKAGMRAYCNAMPPLIGKENIRQFIACVAHGILMEILLSNNSGRLLYAAQVASSTQSRSEAKRSAN